MKNLWVATRKGLFRLGKSAGKWKIEQHSFPAENCTMMMVDPRDGVVYAALNHGHFGSKMHRSRDNGKTWEPVEVPKYPAMPEGRAPDVHPFTKKVVPWNLEYIWELTPGGKDQPGLLWCGTIPGGLFVSKDYGASWQIIDSLWNHPMRAMWAGGGMDNAGLHSICVDPRNSDHVSVAVSTGGVWTTKDGGKTWNICGKGMRAEYMPPELAYEQNSQDAHRLVQCPASPDHLWVQHHCGIFASDDRGNSWREIKAPPSSFGFGVVVHPNDPKTAWFVPAVKDEHRIPAGGKLVVTRTRDGGQSFDVLTNGLPQENAYDIVYRHSLDLDDSGNILAIGSTTGNLWVSENSGDQWQNISTFLPPIYAVRFG
jgi:photosystem II stability/assembly factor-like uncharacterized protein